MDPMDDVTTSEDDFVFGKENSVYVIYMKLGEKKANRLEKVNGTYHCIWFHPKTGMSVGPDFRLEGKDGIDLPTPPKGSKDDWVLHLTATN